MTSSTQSPSSSLSSSSPYLLIVSSSMLTLFTYDKAVLRYLLITIVSSIITSSSFLPPLSSMSQPSSSSSPSSLTSPPSEFPLLKSSMHSRMFSLKTPSISHSASSSSLSSSSQSTSTLSSSKLIHTLSLTSPPLSSSSSSSSTITKKHHSPRSSFYGYTNLDETKANKTHIPAVTKRLNLITIAASCCQRQSTTPTERHWLHIQFRSDKLRPSTIARLKITQVSLILCIPGNKAGDGRYGKDDDLTNHVAKSFKRSAKLNSENLKKAIAPKIINSWYPPPPPPHHHHLNRHQGANVINITVYAIRKSVILNTSASFTSDNSYVVMASTRAVLESDGIQRFEILLPVSMIMSLLDENNRIEMLLECVNCPIIEIDVVALDDIRNHGNANIGRTSDVAVSKIWSLTSSYSLSSSTFSSSPRPPLSSSSHLINDLRGNVMKANFTHVIPWRKGDGNDDDDDYSDDYDVDVEEETSKSNGDVFELYENYYYGEDDDDNDDKRWKHVGRHNYNIENIMEGLKVESTCNEMCGTPFLLITTEEAV